ncbi:hypothetical protein BDN70DRAFT_880899 [Pholiota conissans]|uniref:Uncharacterized protein n=1 Tax=Pholiota conissans TaxID=109636 RepID=A0A9P5YXY8_9AGAR|nr:hypothetical protein BDN70DRAFT_880899 [Pholiota conissans]
MSPSYARRGNGSAPILLQYYLYMNAAAITNFHSLAVFQLTSILLFHPPEDEEIIATQNNSLVRCSSSIQLLH